MKYAQIVVGPAGSGKSTYCSSLVKHGEASRRRIDVVNLGKIKNKIKSKLVSSMYQVD